MYMPACLCVPCAYTCVASLGHICDYVEGHLCGEFCDVMMYAMSVFKQAFIVHRRTVGGAQLQGMVETSTHHLVNTLCVTYLKCISLFIGRGVSLATFKMYNFIIIWEQNWASFGLVFEGDWAGNFSYTGVYACSYISCAWMFADAFAYFSVYSCYFKTYFYP